MPLYQLLLLFFQEIGVTFTEREVTRKRKRIVRNKKNTEQPIRTGKIKSVPTFSFKIPLLHVPKFTQVRNSAFTSAMKRVFTPGPVKKNSGKVAKGKLETKQTAQETIVFSTPSNR